MGSKLTRGAVGAVLLICLSSPLAASADPTPSPSNSGENGKKIFEQFQIARDAYNEILRIRSQQIKEINKAFKAAIEKSTLDYRNAMAVAKNPDQKNLVASARKAAVSAAIIARDNAIAALGAEPTPPAEPMKSKKTLTKSKGR